MRIDAFNHFFPAGYYKKMEEVAGDLKDMFRRTRAVKSIHDLETRLRVVEQFPDYAQILSLPAPTLETVGKGRPEVAAELARIGNDGLAELVAKHPRHFPAFIAQVPLSAPATRASPRPSARITELGAVGVQIYTNVGGKPLDRPEFEPFFAAMNRIGKPDLDPPRARRRPPRLHGREEVALRDLVDVRLALRDQRGDVAPGVLQDPRQVSQPQDHRAPPGRHGALP